MVMGMSLSEYWDGDPRLAVYYRRAYKMRREVENEQAWLQGFYIYDAFAVCLANGFSKRGAKKQQYLDKPVDIYPVSERERKRRERAEYAQMQKAMEQMRRDQQRRKLAKGD